MLAANNEQSKKAVSKSASPAAGRLIETLEGRQLMSATPVSSLATRLDVPKLQPALTVGVATSMPPSFAGSDALQGIRVAIGALAGEKLTVGAQTAKTSGRFGKKDIAASAANILKQIETLAKVENAKVRQTLNQFAVSIPISPSREILLRAIANMKA